MMRRLGLLGLLFVVFLGVGAPARAVDMGNVVEGLRDHGKEWLKDKAKEAGKEWLFGTGQSDTMKAILERVQESSNPDMPGQAAEVCKVAVYNQVFSILSNLGYKTSIKEGASLVPPPAQRRSGWLSAVSARPEKAAPSIGSPVSTPTRPRARPRTRCSTRSARSFRTTRRRNSRCSKKSGTCGVGKKCEYQLKALWDIVHGRYYVYIHGDCRCSHQGAGDGLLVVDGGLSYSGPMLMKISEDKESFTWVPGEPKPIDMDADCPCSHRTLRTAYAPKTPVTTPQPPATALPPPPTTIEGWLHVTTTCDPCKSIAAQINAAAQELDKVTSDFDQAQAEYNRAKTAIDNEGGDKKLGIAPATPAQVKANKAALDAAKARVAELGGRGGGA